MTNRPGPLSTLLLLVASVAVALGVGELMLRAAGWQLCFADQRGWQVCFDRALLFRLRPHSRSDIDGRGFRDRDAAPEDGAKRKVVLLGDSFTMGWNLAPEETIPQVAERELGAGLRVYDRGVIGYGPDQSLLLLADDVLPLRPSAVVLDVFAGNDFLDLEKDRLFSVDAAGALVRTPSNPVSELLPRSRLWCFALQLSGRGCLRPDDEERLKTLLFRDVESPFRRREETLALARAVLAEMQAELAREGVPLLVAILPSVCAVSAASALCAQTPQPFPGDARNEERWSEIAAQLGLPTLALIDRFRAYPGNPDDLFAPGDFHLSALGARLAGEAIARALRERVPALAEATRP